MNVRTTATMHALALGLTLSGARLAAADGPPPATTGAAPTPADLAAAKALFAAALTDEQAGRWADALTKVRRASAVKLTPGLRFHIALCQERLGHLVSAAASYRDAQAAARAEKNQEVQDLVTEPLQDLKVRTPTVTVNVPRRFTSGGATGEVRLDGATLPLATLGTAVPVDVGAHTIQATAPGQTPYAMTLTVVERQAATLDIQFLPLGGALPAPAPAIVVAPVAGAAPVAVVPSAPAAAEHAGPAQSNTLAIAATAGAVALVGVGVGAYALSGSEQADKQRLPTRAWDATALGAWIAAAGVGTGAIVLWTRPDHPEHHEDSGHAELRVGPGSLAVVGTF